MRKIAPIGKRNFVGRKFKSVGANELTASDKNVIKNNINKYTNQQLATRIGKPVEIIVKFIKKEKLISIIDIQEVEKLKVDVQNTIVFTETQLTKNSKINASKVVEEKGRKTSEIAKKKIDFIKENYQKLTRSELAKALGASPQTVRYHLEKLKLTPKKEISAKQESFSEAAIFIKENYQKYTVSELSKKLNFSTDGVRYYLRKFNLKALRVSKSKEISPQVIAFLRVNYHSMTAREMSNALGNLNWSAVRYLCEKHGFLRTAEETTAIRKRWRKIEFSESEVKYILANHGKISMNEIANNIERTRSSVVNFLIKKGLKITKEQHNILNKRNFELARMKTKNV